MFLPLTAICTRWASFRARDQTNRPFPENDGPRQTSLTAISADRPPPTVRLSRRPISPVVPDRPDYHNEVHKRRPISGAVSSVQIAPAVDPQDQAWPHWRHSPSGSDWPASRSLVAHPLIQTINTGDMRRSDRVGGRPASRLSNGQQIGGTVGGRFPSLWWPTDRYLIRTTGHEQGSRY